MSGTPSIDYKKSFIVLGTELPKGRVQLKLGDQIFQANISTFTSEPVGETDHGEHVWRIARKWFMPVMAIGTVLVLLGAMGSWSHFHNNNSDAGGALIGLGCAGLVMVSVAGLRGTYKVIADTPREYRLQEVDSHDATMKPLLIEALTDTCAAVR